MHCVPDSHLLPGQLLLTRPNPTDKVFYAKFAWLYPTQTESRLTSTKLCCVTINPVCPSCLACSTLPDCPTCVESFPSFSSQTEFGRVLAESSQGIRTNWVCLCSDCVGLALFGYCLPLPEICLILHYFTRFAFSRSLRSITSGLVGFCGFGMTITYSLSRCCFFGMIFALVFTYN